MQKSDKFFIFTWRELLVLVLAALTAIGFFFTLGLHYGKKIGTELKPAEPAVVNLEPSPEVAPPKEVLEEGAQHSESATNAAIKAETEAAIHENDLKVEHPKPVDLPANKVGESKTEEAVKPHAPAETEKAGPESAEKTVAAKAGSEAANVDQATEPAEAEPKAEPEKFAIQLGSYPSPAEAKKRIAVFAKRGLKTEMRTAVVNGETRYRVVLPGFKMKKQADLKGKELRSARKIENFVVIKSE